MLSLTRTTPRRGSPSRTKGGGQEGRKPELSPSMTATTLTRRTRKVHPSEVRRRSKVLEEAARRNISKGLDKMATDPTPMRDGEVRTKIGMILCPKIKGEPEVHLRSSSTLTTTMILDIQRAVVEAATDSQVIVDKLIADKVENLQEPNTTTNTEAPQLSLSDLVKCPRTTIVEALPQCTAEMDHQLDHHQGTSRGILQAGVLSEADQVVPEEVTWANATSKCHTGQATTPETVPSEWTRSATNHWKTCTVVRTIRLSETEPSGPNEVPSTVR